MKILHIEGIIVDLGVKNDVDREVETILTFLILNTKEHIASDLVLQEKGKKKLNLK